jgi:cell division protein FtsW
MAASTGEKNRDKQTGMKYDLLLLFPVLLLVGIGIVMVYSASSALAMKKFGSDLYFLKKQAAFSLVGFTALVVCRHLPYRLFRSLAYPILFVSLLSLIAVKISGLGYTAGGATRWIHMGAFTFQPSEFARVAMVIFLAYSMSKKAENMKAISIGFIPHVVILGIFSYLIMVQPDFGSVVILCMITWIMLFVGGARIFHLLGTLLALLPVVWVFMTSAEYRLKRLTSFMDPWAYPSDEGYQVVHSLLAFGTGGIWGTGIGKGYQKLFYLPEPHTDFIFSVIGEELGLIGVLVILCLYAAIFWRGIIIAVRTEDAFGALLAVGLTTATALQVCVNMCVSLGLLPTKGLTLPLLSYGGTSLVLSMASMGILMNISARMDQPSSAVRYHNPYPLREKGKQRLGHAYS